MSHRIVRQIVREGTSSDNDVAQSTVHGSCFRHSASSIPRTLSPSALTYKNTHTVPCMLRITQAALHDNRPPDTDESGCKAHRTTRSAHQRSTAAPPCTRRRPRNSSRRRRRARHARTSGRSTASGARAAQTPSSLHMPPHASCTPTRTRSAWIWQPGQTRTLPARHARPPAVCTALRCCGSLHALPPCSICAPLRQKRRPPASPRPCGPRLRGRAACGIFCAARRGAALRGYPRARSAAAAVRLGAY